MLSGQSCHVSSLNPAGNLNRNRSRPLVATQSALKLDFACSQKHPILGCSARLRQPERLWPAGSEISPIGDRELTGAS
eukprot:COSAG01_NODE_2602_length_7394_cov_2.281563_9_plen_78_part_00